MVSNAMKTDTPIGVILIKDGNEVGPAPEIYDIGTLSEISYWHKRTDGLLGITLKGIQRFNIKDIQVNASQLITADVELIDNIGEVTLNNANKHLASFLENILDQLDPPFKTIKRKLDDAEWLSARLLELLPAELGVKQSLLEGNKVSERLAVIDSILKDAKH